MNKTLLLLPLILALFIFPNIVFAQTAAEINKLRSTLSTTEQSKLRNCLSLESQMKTDLSNLMVLTGTMAVNLETIYTKTESYYRNTLTTQNKTLPGYDNTSSSISQNFNTIRESINRSREASNKISCTSREAKNYFQEYRTNMGLAVSLLKQSKEELTQLLLKLKDLETLNP